MTYGSFQRWVSRVWGIDEEDVHLHMGQMLNTLKLEDVFVPPVFLPNWVEIKYGRGWNLKRLEGVFRAADVLFRVKTRHEYFDLFYGRLAALDEALDAELRP